MDSGIYRHSVGLVGFLGSERPADSDIAPTRRLAMVGSSNSLPKPDHEADHKTDRLAVDHSRDTKEREIDRLAHADGWRPLPPKDAPAYSLLAT